MKNSVRNWLKRTAWLSAGLCALGCLLPVTGLSMVSAGFGPAVFVLGLAAVVLGRNSKKAEESCTVSCGCVTGESTEVPIACDLTAISSEKRGEHIERAKNLFASFREIKELSDGYAFRLPPDSDSIIQAALFTATERLCCPFFTFTLQINGKSVWLSLTGSKSVKQYLHDTMVNEGEILSLGTNRL